MFEKKFEQGPNSNTGNTPEIKEKYPKQSKPVDQNKASAIGRAMIDGSQQGKK
jgi:hypothetical protein